MIYRFVVDGGPWMLPILAASVMGLALGLERTWYWVLQALVRDRPLRTRLRTGDSPPPSQTVRDPVARVLVEAVRRPDDLGIASARAEAILRESKAYLGLLRFVGGTAAVGGLLGTALGIREVLQRTGDPAQANAGIANALHPTILGLAVFLGVHVAAAAFHALSASLAGELDEHLDDVARIMRRAPIVPPRSGTPSESVRALAPPPSLAPAAPASPVPVASPAPVGPAPTAPAASPAPTPASPSPVVVVAVDRSKIQRAEPAPSPAAGPDAHELAQALAAAGGE